jgi:hypothetical protein
MRFLGILRLLLPIACAPPSLSRTTVTVLASILAAAGTMVALMVAFEIPEGMPWSFRARDHDAGLTRAARRALPIAAAVDAFRTARGTCPSSDSAADVGAVTAFLPADQRATIASAAGGPQYFAAPSSPTVCRVAMRLTHDEMLYRQSDGSWVRWLYDPGDGSEPRAVDLSP